MKIARALRRLSRAFCAALALLLVMISAGVPELIEIAVGAEEAPCSTPCDLADNDNRCSPLCHAGACAKLASASIPAIVFLLEQDDTVDFSDVRRSLLGEYALSASPGVADAVFHPPRA